MSYLKVMRAVFRTKMGSRSLLIFVGLLLGSYLFGAYSYQKSIFPFSFMNDFPTKTTGSYDSFGRLIKISGKQEIDCPVQTKETAVLLSIGQSNSANHAEKKITTKYPLNVFNYHNGRCYVAASPLLGATGEEGEFLTPLSDKLIDNGTYKSVVIISSGIGGTPLARWQIDGDLNEMLINTLSGIKNYKVTEIIWHQGETDFGISLNTKMYEKSFNSLKESLIDIGVTAPYFIAVATKCGNNPHWKPINPVTIAQNKLTDQKKVFLAVNTDDLLTKDDRRSDLCHFSENGQYKVAEAYAEAIRSYHNTR